MGNVSARCRRVLDITRGFTVEDAMDTEYDSLEQVTEALREAGLESSNLIVGIDFTKSNEWTGKSSFGGRSLHDTGGNLKNPYEQAILIIGQTLSDFDEDNLIPCFGFGDVTTHDKDVFSFNPDHSSCNGFMEAWQRYRELAPGIKLSGPTSFAPIIETAMRIVDESGGQYHVLLIIADGQVSRSCDVEIGHYSPQEEDTIAAIVEASKYPLSIVLVGVGDGPWELMKEFDDRIPERAFDNFQFVNFTEIMSRDVPMSQKDANFAAEALMEVPAQYQASIKHRLLGRSRGTPRKHPLPPPSRRHAVTNFAANSPSFFQDHQLWQKAKRSPPAHFQDHQRSYSPFWSLMLSAFPTLVVVSAFLVFFRVSHFHMIVTVSLNMNQFFM